ncbi:MAG: hypothetical protein PF495_05220 [Spirochaetales bacterium]|jgi:hypothetical protein|nr:hypothetical protein [Spirochaetales bacterium]
MMKSHTGLIDRLRDRLDYGAAASSVSTIPEGIVATSGVMISPGVVRKVGIRELNRGISGQLRDLPFDITRNGEVIARVEAK